MWFFGAHEDDHSMYRNTEIPWETSTNKLPNWVCWWHFWRWCVFVILWFYNLVCIFLHVINRTLHLYLHFYVFIYKWHCILNIKRGSYICIHWTSFHSNPRFFNWLCNFADNESCRACFAWNFQTIHRKEDTKKTTNQQFLFRNSWIIWWWKEMPGGGLPPGVGSVRLLGCFLPGAPAYVQIQATGSG